ncbi:MAG: type II CAAX endopeptidase family protein [Candidatus Sulfotelmatobacter sp.]
MSSPANPQFDPQPLPSDPQPPTTPVADAVPSPVLLPTPRPPKSGENPVWNGWDVLQIAGFTLLILFVAQLAIVAGARHFIFRHESWLQIAQNPALALLSEFLTYIVIAMYMVFLVEGKYHVRFGQAIRWNWPGVAAFSFLGVGVLMLGFDILGRFIPMPKTTPFDQFFARPLDAYLTAVFAVTLGPLMEELFFRGFLYPVLARRLGVFWGIILTALPFGLIHAVQYGYAWGAVLVIFLVGIVLTTVRATTKSVGASFLAHVGYNGTLMIISIIATDGFRHMEKLTALLFSTS